MPQVILAEDTLAATPGRLVAIKVLRRQHALAGQRVGAAAPPRPPTTNTAAAAACFYSLRLLPHSTPHMCFCYSWQHLFCAWWVLLQEARALRYLHAAAPGGTAPGVVRLLGAFTLGAHYCLVTGGCYS